MDYKSQYRHEGTKTIMTVKTSPTLGLFLLLIGLAVLLLGIFHLAREMQKPDWEITFFDISPPLVGFFLVFFAWKASNVKTVISIDKGSLTVEHKGALITPPPATLACESIQSVKKDTEKVYVGNGRRMDYYTIYLTMKTGERVDIMRINSDVKMADEIRHFIRTRSGLG